jgi:hypothetical protein
MKKSLITLAVLSLALAPVISVAEPAPAGSQITRNADGTTTEVRHVTSSGQRKGKTTSKIVITRDSAGKIISVKRG